MVASDPVPDPVPRMPESACAAVVPDPVTVPDPVPDPVPGTPVSASAMVVPDVKTSVSKPRKKKPRPSQPAMASCPAKSSSVPAKSVPVTSTPVAESPPPTYWKATCDTGRGYVVKDCTGASVYFDFGRLTRSTTFEYDRFVVPTCVIMSRRLLVLLLPRLCLLVPCWSFPSLPSKLFSSHRP